MSNDSVQTLFTSCPRGFFTKLVDPVTRLAWLTNGGKMTTWASEARQPVRCDRMQSHCEWVAPGKWQLHTLVVCGEHDRGLDLDDDRALGSPINTPGANLFIVSELWIQDSLEQGQLQQLSPYVMHAPRTFQDAHEVVFARDRNDNAKVPMDMVSVDSLQLPRLLKKFLSPINLPCQGDIKPLVHIHTRPRSRADEVEPSSVKYIIEMQDAQGLQVLQVQYPGQSAI